MLFLLMGGCVDLPELCHFKAGDADVHLEGLDGGAPRDGYIYLPYSGTVSCVHHLSFSDGSDLTLVCEAGYPVTRCSLEGVCAVPDGGTFGCQGEVTFQ